MLKKQTKRKTKKRTARQTPRSGSKPRSSTNKPTHVYLNSWGFIRVPKQYVDKLPFKANDELEIVIDTLGLRIFKKSSSKSMEKLETKINKALRGKITIGNEDKDLKKCDKHKIEYSDFCPICKTLEKAEENEKKQKEKIKEMVPA